MLHTKDATPVIFTLLACLAFAHSTNAGVLLPYTGENREVHFNLPDTGGEKHSERNFRDRIVLVNFWASWCLPCVREMPGLERLNKLFSGKPFQVVAINVGETRFKVWKFVKLIGFELPVLLDPEQETFQSWGGSVLPTSYLLDRQGIIRYVVPGSLEWDSEEVVTLVDELLAEE